MKKLILFGIFLMQNFWVEAQIPVIDPTAIQRLIQLKNLVDKAKRQIGELKNTVRQTAGTKMNTTSIVETQSQIEDFLRNSDEFVKMTFKGGGFADLSEWDKNSQGLKKSFASNISSTWKLSDVMGYLNGSQFSENSGAEFYDLLTKGMSLDNKNGISKLDAYLSNNKSFQNRQYALQTALQKKKLQQAFAYYKMADELEKNAYALNAGIKSNSAGKAFSLKNNGILDLGDDSGGDIFGDLFTAGNIFNGQQFPSFGSTSSVNINGQNFVTDVNGNVYDANGNFVTNDISFGIGALAIQKAQQETNDKSLWQTLTTSSPNVVKYADEIFKQRLEAQAQQKAQDIQNTITQKIMDNMYNPSVDYNDNSYNSPPIGFGLSGKSGLRMSTGERILGNKAAIDLLVEAQKLREKGDELMLQAIKRTDEQKSLEANWGRQLLRESLSKVKLRA